MKPRDRRNPHRLIVEGHDDLHTVVHLTGAHGVDWDADGSFAPYIRDAGGRDQALRELPLSLRNQRKVGIILDTDLSSSNTWQCVRQVVKDLAE